MKRGSRTDEVFTLIFMILAIGAVICFFFLGGYKGSDDMTYVILGGVAVMLRLAQYIVRMF